MKPIEPPSRAALAADIALLKEAMKGLDANFQVLKEIAEFHAEGASATHMLIGAFRCVLATQPAVDWAAVRVKLDVLFPAGDPETARFHLGVLDAIEMLKREGLK